MACFSHIRYSTYYFVRRIYKNPKVVYSQLSITPRKRFVSFYWLLKTSQNHIVPVIQFGRLHLTVDLHEYRTRRSV